MMNRKTLGILAVALVVLGALSVLTGRSRYSTAEGGGYEAVLGGTVDPGSIHSLKAWLGSAPDEPVELERSGDGWVVASRWGWKAKEDLVRRLVEDLSDLKGEKRASSEEVLADFQADDEKGLHIVASADGGSELFHLVVGKTALRGGTFVRAAGSNDVYLTPASLRSSFGIWGEDPKPPDPKRWIELRVHQADRQDVDRIVLHEGSTEIVLEKEFALAEPEPPAEGEEESGTGSEGAEAAEGSPEEEASEEEAEPKVDRSQWTWKADAAGEIDKGKADGILGTLCSLYAFDVADPDSLAAYGLEDPERSVDIAFQDGRSVTMYFGGTTDDEKKVYFRVGKDGKPALLYKATVDRIFLSREDLKPQA